MMISYGNNKYILNWIRGSDIIEAFLKGDSSLEPYEAIQTNKFDKYEQATLKRILMEYYND